MPRAWPQWIASRTPQYWCHYSRAICHHYLGRPDAARDAVQQALLLRPELTVTDVQSGDPFRAPEIVERIATALLASGLPA